MSDLPHVFDGHNDVLLKVESPERGWGQSFFDLLGLDLPRRGGGRSFFERADEGHLDLPRARDGSFDGGIFVAFVTNEESSQTRETDAGKKVTTFPAVDPDRARRKTYALLDTLHALETHSDGDLRIVRSVDDLRATFASDPLAAVVGLEGAAAVRPDLSNLDTLYERGVRSLGLVWSRPNAFGHGVPFGFPGSPDIGPGLTDAGRDLVSACNEMGIVVDMAHLNEAGFWDVVDISSDPLVVSHTGIHELSPGTRNLTDDQLDAIADSGGIVGITFTANSIRSDGKSDLDTSISTLVDHFEYVADRIGVEHVAFGSDFDGAPILDSVGDVTGLPDVLQELQRRGFTDRDLRKIAHENWFRVFEATWI